MDVAAAPKLKPDDGGKAPAADAAIEISGVSLRFDTGDGPVEALSNVSLRVARGEFVSFIGPSGCGKSTLLRAVADLETPTSGSIRVNGMSPHQARASRAYGYVFQTPALYPRRPGAHTDWHGRRPAAHPLPLAQRIPEALRAPPSPLERPAGGPRPSPRRGPRAAPKRCAARGPSPPARSIGAQGRWPRSAQPAAHPDAAPGRANERRGPPRSRRLPGAPEVPAATLPSLDGCSRRRSFCRPETRSSRCSG